MSDETTETSELHVYELDDGEIYLIAAKSEEEALRFGREDYEIPSEEGEEVACRMLPDDEVLTIGYEDDDPEDVPEGATVDWSKGRPRVTATCAAWAKGCAPGAFIGSSIW